MPGGDNARPFFLLLGGALPVLLLNLPDDEELAAQDADDDEDGEPLEAGGAALPRRLRDDVPHLDWFPFRLRIVQRNGFGFGQSC